MTEPIYYVGHKRRERTELSSRWRELFPSYCVLRDHRAKTRDCVSRATFRKLGLISLLLFSVLPSTGCLFRSRTVQSHLSTAPLQTATQEQLLGLINEQAAQVRTMNATVDIDTSVGGEKKGKVTEYQEIRGYILAEKPRMLRMIGLMPVVRNRAFDMVSDGDTFKLWIPPKNRFITGKNEVTKPSPNSLENLRPWVIYEALLPRAIDKDEEIAVLEAGMQNINEGKKKETIRQPDYRLQVIRRAPNGSWYLARRIYFERESLKIYRQRIFDQQGNMTTDATYSGYQDFNGIPFPSHIDIVRPIEEYTIGLHILKLTLNEDMKPEQFELQQPPGAQVTVLGNGNGANNHAAQAQQ